MSTGPPPLRSQSESSNNGKKIIAAILAALMVLLLFGLVLYLFLGQIGETGNMERASAAFMDRMKWQSAEEDKRKDTMPMQEVGSNSGLETTKSKEKLDSESTGEMPFDLKKEPANLATVKFADEEQLKYSGSGAAGAAKGLMPVKTIRGFFGTEAKGNHVIYVVDISRSMSESYGSSENRLERAKNELQESISELSEIQKFSIYFFSDTVTYDPRFIGQRPSLKNQTKLKEWLDQIFCQSGTDPLPAIKRAFSEKCDEIFLLSDGEFGYGTADLIRRSNKFNARINTISLGRSSDSLKRIAEENSGQYIEPPFN